MDFSSPHSPLRVVLQHVDGIRSSFNRACSHTEAWQIVSYTMSVVFFAMWLRRMTKSNKPIFDRIRAIIYSVLHTFPWVKLRLKESLKLARAEIEEEIHQYDTPRDFYRFIPERGLSGEDIVNEARQYAEMGERLGLGTVHSDPRTREKDMKTLLQVFDLVAYSDPHRSDAFPGVRKMEAEVLKMVCSMLHGGSSACGVVCSGGTEAILLACLAYRNMAQARGVVRPEMVVPSTAHPAFDKAATLFDMGIVKVPVRADDRVDVHAMKRSITKDTCMLAGSAPNHVTGTIDQIERISELAVRYGVPMHVDASLGGFLLPFMEFADFDAPTYDFRLPGVTSISIDLHRYGQSPRRCSVLSYRDDSYMRHHCYLQPSWRGGVYSTPTLQGGRDGGCVAAAWTTLLQKGRASYIDATQRIVDGTRRLAEAIRKVDGVSTIGGADLCMVTIRTEKVNVYALSDRLVSKGWHCDPLLYPSAARIPVTLVMCEDGVVEEFVEDLTESIAELAGNPHLESESKTAAFYEMVQSVGDRSLIDEICLLRLHAHYSMPAPVERRATRSLSVEGRKLSMIGGIAGDIAREVRERTKGIEKEAGHYAIAKD